MLSADGEKRLETSVNCRKVISWKYKNKRSGLQLPRWSCLTADLQGRIRCLCLQDVCHSKAPWDLILKWSVRVDGKYSCYLSEAAVKLVAGKTATTTC